MKKNNCLLSVFLLVLTISFISPNHTFANSNSAEFGVKPIYPENQEKEKDGYFSLITQPGNKQTIKVKVTNYSDKPNNIKVARNRATTSDSGLIEYSNSKKEKEKSVLHDFNQIVTLKEEAVLLEPKESKELDIDVSMPDESYDGVILGGLYFSEDNELSKEEQEKSIRNTFSYSIPIVLKMTDKKIENELTLKNVEPTERNSRPFIEARLVNSAPSVIKSMSVEGRIYNAKTKEEYYVNKETSLEMAPNSILNFGFDLQNAAFIAGDYLIDLKVNADGKEYHFEDGFTIEKAKAKELNEKSTYIEEKNTPWLLIVGGIVLVVGLSILVTLFVVKRSKKKITKGNKTVSKKGKKRKKSNKV